jgi:hypothetical protein
MNNQLACMNRPMAILAEKNALLDLYLDTFPRPPTPMMKRGILLGRIEVMRIKRRLVLVVPALGALTPQHFENPHPFLFALLDAVAGVARAA